MLLKWRPVFASVVASIFMAGCLPAPGPPLPLAQNVDLSRMYGRWFIVATIPNRVERGMVAAYDIYSPRTPDSLREDFYFKQGGFLQPEHHLTTNDKIEPDSGSASWKVQIVWPVRLPFLLTYVDPDYRFALFGERGRDLGWIYAREPILSEQDYQRLLKKFADAGYQTASFRKIIQSPDQVGQPGFWSDGVSQSR